MQRLVFAHFISGLMLAGYWALLFILTHIRIDSLPGTVHWSDKVVHLLAYAGLGMLAAWYLSIRGSLKLRTAVALILILIGYATVDELTQGLLPYRQADIWDWAADIIGGGLGISVVGFVLAVIGWKWAGAGHHAMAADPAQD